jgi:UDP-N-acetylglucosamine--N-acetylmuramyl-(pentapeptide) pyrophosphoryl-undecaprenol N-acetylglucosamine transferase
VGVGGYSSGPVVLVAAVRGIPTMVLEQNAVPGLTNRTLSRWVRAAAVTYAETLPYFGNKGFVAGNPVREEFFTATSNFEGRTSNEELRTSTSGLRTGNVPTLLVIGGSQGSHAINVAVVGAASAVTRTSGEFALVHQTGERDAAEVRRAYAAANVGARVEAFLDPMAQEMAGADLVVCRAGATTLAELAAAGKPAVLVPFPAATDDHQRKNARVLADAGAAVLIEQRDLTAERLARTVADLFANGARLDAMGRAMRGFARPDAADRIVDRLLEIVKRR